ncbi:MAG: hypothetical protein SVM80_07550 [Halobacteriota archaeon]|nr:hypothetical protein [Halobacteriota archaeon]
MPLIYAGIYLAQIVFALLLFQILTSRTDKTISFPLALHLKYDTIFSTALIVASIILMISSPIKEGLWMRSFWVLIVISFLPGYALLRLFGLNSHFYRLELLLLSHIFSFIFVAFCTLVILISEIPITTLYFSFILIGILSLIRCLKDDEKPALIQISKSEALAILISLLCFAIPIVATYPGYSFVAGSDIANNFWQARVLVRSPVMYSESERLLFNLFEGAFLALSDSTIAVFQTSLAFLILMLPLSFYVMAREYLEQIDDRLPSMALIFWSFLSDFVFLSLIRLRFTQGASFGNSASEIISFLSTLSEKTGGIFSSHLRFWYIPLTFSLTVLFFLLLLLKRTDIPRRIFLPVFTFLFTGMFLSHVVEAAVFALFLALYGAYSRNSSVRIDDALWSSLSGLGLSYAILLLTGSFTKESLNPSIIVTIVIPIAIVALVISILFRLRDLKMNIPINEKMFTTFFFISYALALVVWFLFFDLDLSQVALAGIVPWFLYPVALGIAGFLALLAIPRIIADEQLKLLLGPILAFMLFSFIMGKGVSLVNVNLFNVVYTEQRFLYFLLMGVSILAPISLLKFSRIGLKSPMIFKVTSIITIIALFMTSSFLLGLEYRSSQTFLFGYPSESGVRWDDMIDGLVDAGEVFDDDPRSLLITASTPSWMISRFISPNYLMPESESRILWRSSGSELPLYIFYRDSHFSHPYIFLHSWDEIEEYELLVNLRDTLPVVLEDKSFLLLNLSTGVPPLPSSDTILITSEDAPFYIYAPLFLGHYEYTTAKEWDPIVREEGKRLIIPLNSSPDYISSTEILKEYKDHPASVIILMDFGKPDEYHFADPDRTINANALKQVPGAKEIVYINAQNAHQLTQSKDLLKLSGINLPAFDYDDLPRAEGFFRKAHFEGEVELETSLISLSEPDGMDVNIRSDNGNLTLEDVTSILTHSKSGVILKTKDGELDDGDGFYVRLKTSGRVEIKPEEGKLTFIVKTGSGEDYTLNDVSEVIINETEKLPTLSRVPDIRVQGLTHLNETYLFGSLYWRYRTYGENLTVSGNFSCRFFISDTYTFMEDVSLDGEVARHPPYLNTSYPIALIW